MSRRLDPASHAWDPAEAETALVGQVNAVKIPLPLRGRGLRSGFRVAPQGGAAGWSSRCGPRLALAARSGLLAPLRCRAGLLSRALAFGGRWGQAETRGWQVETAPARRAVSPGPRWAGVEQRTNGVGWSVGGLPLAGSHPFCPRRMVGQNGQRSSAGSSTLWRSRVGTA